MFVNYVLKDQNNLRVSSACVTSKSEKLNVMLIENPPYSN